MIKNINKREILFLAVLIIFCTARCTFECFPDNDLWTRLLVGSSIIDGLSIMKRDIFSYFPTHIWFDHEWGASVFIYAFFKAFREYGLLLLKILLTFGTLFFMFKTIKLRPLTNTTPYNILLYALALTGASYAMGGTVRCHLFTFFFFSLFLFILENVRLKGFKHWWVMPLIMLFWSNIHGGCVSGIGLLVMYAIGEKLNGKPIGFYVKALIASCLVTFINPWGISYVIFLLKAVTMNRGEIAEWFGTFYDGNPNSFIYFKFYLYLMGTTGIASVIRKIYLKEKFDKTKIIALITSLYLSVAHIKHQPFFVIVWTVFLYDDFYIVWGTLIRKFLFFIKSDKVINILIIIKDITAYTIVLFFSFLMLSAFSYPLRITGTSYPYQAIEFIRLNNLKGKLFINFDWGSYAEYKLFPYCKIAMDGRFEEAFDPKIIYKMQDFHMLKNNQWYAIIEMYPPDIMVIEKKYPVYKEILKKAEWSPVFENNLTGVFISEKLKKDKYLYPPEDFNYYERTKFDKNFSFVKRIKKE